MQISYMVEVKICVIHLSFAVVPLLKFSGFSAIILSDHKRLFVLSKIYIISSHVKERYGKLRNITLKI